MHGGIVFYRTRMLDTLSDFYTRIAGCTLWLDQGACRIYRFGNQLLGFCAGKDADISGIITFVYDSNREVDAMWKALTDASARFVGVSVTTPPRDNETFGIYQCFATDPEGRTIEFQRFYDSHAEPVSKLNE